ncbi:hypothetical protein JAAARDRAFT_70653 [Jaapia argillacea MUCL 33604]|uniref:Uncharacterized protein n=1 Tax=Jaapia argillacea MUCL 33604 TaxID=933084 RepID=A0A067PNG9_9AGAM|nr:hypothetical protein JAAARDRAFT_70653 [Jaapia argillacea MUCL 33604]
MPTGLGGFLANFAYSLRGWIAYYGGLQFVRNPAPTRTLVSWTGSTDHVDKSTEVDPGTELESIDRTAVEEALRELEICRGRLEVTVMEKESLEKRLEGVVAEKDEIAVRLDAVEKEKAELEKRVSGEEKGRKAAEEAAEASRVKTVELQDQMRTLQEKVTADNAITNKAKEEITTLVSTLDEQKQGYETLAAQHDHILSLLESRSAELQVAQTFLSTTDSASVEGVTQKVQDLNGDIHHIAASMAESFQFKENKIDPSKQAVAAREWAETALGPRMAQLLKSTDDPTIVQVALQGCLTMYCHWIIRGWHFDLARENETICDVYDDVYYHMRESEPLAVARRWRALSRKHIQGVVHGDSDVAATLIPPIAERLIDILLVAGCKSNLKQINDTVKSKLLEKIKGVVSSSLDINKLMGQDILSCDLDATWASPEEAYDSAWMVDIDPEQTEKKEGAREVPRVLATVELGVGRMDKVKADDDEDEWEDTAIVRAKVVLESMVEWDMGKK